MAEEHANRLLKNSFLENVNKKSDFTVTKIFHEEYYKLIDEAKDKQSNLYLLDVLERLNFIDQEILKTPNYSKQTDRYTMLKVVLRSQNNNLMVVSN